MMKLSLNHIHTLDKSDGQAVITLLFFMIVAIIVTSGAIIVTLTNSLSGSTLQEGILAYYTAESGGENAIIRLLRNPNYSGENLAVDGGQAQITVSGTNPKIISSKGIVGNYVKTIEIQADISNNIVTILSWKEK